jgi:murein L,D-transpeptidase YcbB/YkuD
VHEPAAGDSPELRRAWERACAFYTARNHEPAWLDEDGAAAARVLAARMRAAGEDGLDPAAYDAPARGEELERLRSAAAPEHAAARVDADVRFTLATFRFSSDLALGRWGGAASDRSLDSVEVVSAARDAAAAQHALQRLEPAHPEYRQLRERLTAYRALAAKGGWPTIAAGLRLAPVASAKTTTSVARRAGVAALRARLAAEGDLSDSSSDAALQAAVRRAQARFGLPQTGTLDRATVAALNVSAEARARQIALNMDRWRRLPQDLGRRHLRVNTPEFTLRFVVDGQPRGSMKVVAGEPATPTPVLSDVVSYLEFQPYWNVPESLALEMVPKILKDPGYLAARRLDVVEGWEEPGRVVPPSKVPWKTLVHSMRPYRLRQRSGGSNALGMVKFMFPNLYSVYLHDTPDRAKFLPRVRAFSNGCVRVEHPARVAEFLLDGDRRWPRAAIARAMKAGGRQVVDLAAPVPVHLTYLTAWVESGQVHFRPDVYGWDRAESMVPPAKVSP